ncbi:DUF3301 domain-containing protein [Halopseudomonas xiamenensis]|uniref:DUF3301 domain-containing protein n=1 Tax=Halopseudomonas xiamenensis TaxID=157792 RepID=UPI001624565E|nr:DUF3301 domain-containing protein [Halopseudomonas xiamenensis]
MLDLGHVALMLVAAGIGAWIWRGLGLRDRALRIARQHCRQAGVQLLDESVALTRLRLGRGRHGRPGIKRRYSFEFSVTGERRYTGFVELHGDTLLKIELAPHPFPGEPPQDNVHYLQ